MSPPGGAVLKVIWPYGYAGRFDGDRLALVDGDGTVLAYVGDTVRIGGAEREDGAWNGCGGVSLLALPSPVSTAAYVVINIDGPPLDLTVNGVAIAHISCGMSGIDLSSWRTVPALPWQIALTRADGSVLKSLRVEVVIEPRQLVIRGEVAGELSMPQPVGPAPRSPCPS